MQKQVTIIGDGPAGCATAIALIQALVSRQEFFSSGDRRHQIRVTQLCSPKKAVEIIGETIPPAATEYLSQLGLKESLNNSDHLVCPGSISIWGDEKPGYNDFFFNPVGQGFHLDRKKFNDQLLEKSEKVGVTQLADAKLISIQEKHEGYTLKIQVAGQSVSQHADFVVDATGIRAFVARSLQVKRNQYDSVLSACAFYNLKGVGRSAAHTLVSTAESGWWYGAQLPSNQALLSFCSDVQTMKVIKPTQTKAWFDLLKRSDWFYRKCCEQFGMKLGEPEKIVTRVAPSAILSCVVGDKWLAVGDAAASYDSMTSAGITKALQQGIEAGSAIAHYVLSGQRDLLEQYQNDVFQKFNSYLSLHQELYHRERRYPESGFWKRRQQLV